MKRLPPCSLIVLLLALWGAPTQAQRPAFAETTGGYKLRWTSVDGGAGVARSDDGSYEVSATIGQPEAGDGATGTDYTATGGFWAMRASPCTSSTTIFCDGFESQDLSGWSNSVGLNEGIWIEISGTTQNVGLLSASHEKTGRSYVLQRNAFVPSLLGTTLSGERDAPKDARP